MGDWLHVHHGVVCADHATALRLYERLECAGNRIERADDEPTGLLWGFWSPTVVLVTTTSKWGSSPSFIDPLVAGLSAECFTASDDDDDVSHRAVSFEAELRRRLGARRDCLWSDKPDVLKEILAHYEPLDLGLTSVGVVEGHAPNGLPSAVAEALAPHRYSAIVHAFVTEKGGCFALGAFHAGESTRSWSPLWSPVAAARGRGHGAWAIRNVLDGNERLPVLGVSAAELWRIERHGAHGAWQPREQRLARARQMLASASPEERQAGCAVARRWWLPELEPEIEALGGDPSEHVRAAAELALHTLAPARFSLPSDCLDAASEPEQETEAKAELATDPDEVRAALRLQTGSGVLEERVMAWIELARFGDATDLARALELLDDPQVGAAARWTAAQAEATTDALTARIVRACPSLAELASAFLQDACSDDAIGRAFVARVAELAYATTRTSYWMIRYGVPNRDAPPCVDVIDQRPAWRGEGGAHVARIMFWAARTIESAAALFSRETLLRAFVAFDQLLDACRVNPSWFLPPAGIIHAGLEALLTDRVPPGAGSTPGNAELAGLRASVARIAGLHRAAPDESAPYPALEDACVEVLAGISSPLHIDCYSHYGRAAIPLISWIANNFAWRCYLSGAPERALPYAELAVICGDWHDDPARDTLARVLRALGRADKADAIVEYARRRNPSSTAFDDPAG